VQPVPPPLCIKNEPQIRAIGGIVARLDRNGRKISPTASEVGQKTVEHLPLGGGQFVQLHS